MDSDISFHNMDDYRGSGDQALTITQIIMNHINRTVINGSVEWHGGYWENKVANTGSGGQVVRRYVLNTRDIFNSSIIMLRMLLLPRFDEKTKEKDEDIQKKIKSLDKSDKELYENKKIEYHLELFEALILLSHKLNYFAEQSATITI